MRCPALYRESCCAPRHDIIGSMENRYTNMADMMANLKSFFRPGAGAAAPADSASRANPDDLMEDLRLFLHQLARSISEHLEYERQIAHGLPRDSGLVLRFEIADYVSDLFDFFERKQLIGPDEELMLRAATNILVPPESVRDQLSPQHWRRLFAGILAIIADRTGRPYPVLTKQFYEYISRQGTVNGVPTKQVLQSFQEALDVLPTGDTGESTVPHRESADDFDPKYLLKRSFAACGAGSYPALRMLLVRRHGLEFGSALFALSVAAIGAVVLVPWAAPALASSLGAPFGSEPLLIASVLLIYLVLVGSRFQRYRLRALRRKTLVRVSNAIAESVGLSYKDIDEVLHEAYGTSLREMKSALLPKKQRWARRAV